jgi:hypothetical protein
LPVTVIDVDEKCIFIVSHLLAYESTFASTETAANVAAIS